MRKKYVLIFLLFCALPMRIHAMEYNDEESWIQLISDAICAFIFSCFSVNKPSYCIADSQRIQSLRDEAKKVEELIKFSRNNDTILTREFVDYSRSNGLEVNFARFFQAKVRPFILQPNLKPKIFFRYCYYQQYHNQVDDAEFEELVMVHYLLLAQCRKERIEGCSALGIALLAKKTTRSKQCAFIRRLLDAGFEFTEQDKLFLALYLYDGIPMREKKVMTLMLHNDEHSYLSVLPYDVRKYIVHCMVGVSKKEVLPCPP